MSDYYYAEPPIDPPPGKRPDAPRTRTLMDLADGSRIALSAAGATATWYPIVDGRIDRDRPLGSFGTPAAELLERLREYGLARN